MDKDTRKMVEMTRNACADAANSMDALANEMRRDYSLPIEIVVTTIAARQRLYREADLLQRLLNRQD